MENLKRVSVILLVTLLLCMCFQFKVYAAISCSPTISGTSEVEQGAEFTVDIGVGNINGDYGVVTVGGYLEYDKSALTLKKSSSIDGWSRALNTENGKFTADREGTSSSDIYAKSNEGIIRVTFVANEGYTGNTAIKVNGFVGSDGRGDSSTSSSSKTITVKAKSQDNGNQGGNEGGSQGGNNSGSQGGSTGNQGGSSNNASKPVTNNDSNNNSNKPTNNNQEENNNEEQEPPVEEQKPEEDNTPVENTNTIVDEIKKEEEKKFSKMGEEKDNTVVILGAIVVILLVIAIGLFVLIKIKRDRTKKIGRGM